VQKIVLADAPKKVDHAQVLLRIGRRDAEEFLD